MGRSCCGCPRGGTGPQPRESVEVQRVGVLVSLGARHCVPNSRQSPHSGALVTVGTARRVLGEVVKILAQLLEVFLVSVCYL